MHNLANISPNLHDFPFSENILHTEIYAKFRQKSIHIEDESVILFISFLFQFLVLFPLFSARRAGTEIWKKNAWPKNEQRKNAAYSDSEKHVFLSYEMNLAVKV